MNSSISLCIRNKNFISSKTADLPQKYERNFNPVYVCVCIFLIPASIPRLPFHLKIFRRLNFVFTDDMHISAYSDSREIDFSSLGAARSSSQRRVKIFDLSTKDFVFTKFFSPPNFERKLRTTRAIKFYPASRDNFSIFLNLGEIR